MATANIGVTRRQDWILANPWPYAGAGFVLCSLALLTTQRLGADLHFLRGTFFLLGLSASGIAVVLRLNSNRPAYLDGLGPNARRSTLSLLALLFAFVEVLLTGALLARIFGNTAIPWNPGSLIVAWIVLGPMCFLAAQACVRARAGESELPWGHEAAVLLLLVGINCVLACWSLYLGHDQRHAWFTMRLFLSVVAFACFVSAPFLLASQSARRYGLSALFLIHFVGISTAALGQPPQPILIGHLWVRVYRPYLEFMYLNNAYHFYAPEPDASSYMWFRVNYQDGQGKTHGMWYKIPEIDENGWHGHTVALEYQRYLSITENIAQGSGPSGTLFDWSTNPLTKSDDPDWIATYYMTPSMKKRWRLTDTAVFFKRLKSRLDEKAVDIVGQLDPAKPPPKQEEMTLNPMDDPKVYPFHPGVAIAQQYAPPSDHVHRLISSYVRHVARRPHPENPDWGVASVKVYKVKHVIIPADALLNERDPQDPMLYQPYYMGDYDADGQMLNPEDPLLYWMLPIMRMNYSDPRSLTADFARRHAGDENWTSSVNAAGQRRWFQPRREMFERAK